MQPGSNTVQALLQLITTSDDDAFAGTPAASRLVCVVWSKINNNNNNSNNNNNNNDDNDDNDNDNDNNNNK